MHRVTASLRPVLLACLLCLPGLLHAADSEPNYSGLKTRIETSSYEQSLHFYTDVIGLQVLESWDEDGDKGAILGLSDSKDGTAFLELAPATGEASPPSGVSLQFRVADIDAFAAELRGRWSFRGPERRPWGSTYLRLVDPSGLTVIVYQGTL